MVKFSRKQTVAFDNCQKKLAGGANAAEGFEGDTQERGDIGKRYPLYELRIVVEEGLVALLGRFKLDGVHAVLREDEGKGDHFAVEGFYFVVGGGQSVEVVVMDAHYFAGFQGLDDEPAGLALKKAYDGKAKLFVHGKPFGNFLAFFVVIDAGGPFADKENIVAHPLFPQQKMVFGYLPALPSPYK